MLNYLLYIDNFLNCVRDPSQCPEECEVETFYAGCHVCRCSEYHAAEEELPPGKIKTTYAHVFFYSFYGHWQKIQPFSKKTNNKKFRILKTSRTICPRYIFFFFFKLNIVLECFRGPIIWLSFKMNINSLIFPSFCWGFFF